MASINAAVGGPSRLLASLSRATPALGRCLTYGGAALSSARTVDLLARSSPASRSFSTAYGAAWAASRHVVAVAPPIAATSSSSSAPRTSVLAAVACRRLHSRPPLLNSPPPPPSPAPPAAPSAPTADAVASAPEPAGDRRKLGALIPTKETTSSIRKLLELARPEKQTIIWAVGLLVVSSTISMSVPLTIGKLIDFFASADSERFLGLSFPLAAAVLTSFFILGAACNAARAYLMRLSGQRIIARVRKDAYRNVLRQEVEFADKGAGDILSRLGSDTTIVGESVTNNLSDGLRALISAIVGVGAMVYISTKLTMVMLAVVPPVSLGAVFYGRYLRNLSKQTQDALGDMTKVAEEKLSAFRTLTAFNSQPMEVQSFSQKVDVVLNLARKEAMASGIFFGGTGLTGNLTMLCLLGYGGHLVSLGEISVGSLTSLLIYTGYVGGSVSGLTGFFTGLMKGVGAGTRVFELLDRVPTISATDGAVLAKARNGDIVFQGVSFAYPSRPSVQVLKQVDLKIERGTSVAIVGPSGSGKSSFHGLLLRYYDPDQGTITFDGDDIRSFTTDSWRGKLGIVPQDPPLFTGTVFDNIAYGTPAATEHDVIKAARQANCEFVFDLPEGLQTMVGKASLSGGQKQRIAIARALVRNPSVLLLDEATSALDSGAESQVNQAISSILAQKNITVILVAHRLSSIAQAETVVVLESGRVTEQGLYTDLSTSENSRFRHLMAAQLALEGRKSSSPSPPVPASPEALDELAPLMAEGEVGAEERTGEEHALEESAEEIERGRRAASGL